MGLRQGQVFDAPVFSRSPPRARVGQGDLRLAFVGPLLREDLDLPEQPRSVASTGRQGVQEPSLYQVLQRVSLYMGSLVEVRYRGEGSLVPLRNDGGDGLVR